MHGSFHQGGRLGIWVCVSGGWKLRDIVSLWSPQFKYISGRNFHYEPTRVGTGMPLAVPPACAWLRETPLRAAPCLCLYLSLPVCAGPAGVTWMRGSSMRLLYPLSALLICKCHRQARVSGSQSVTKPRCLAHGQSPSQGVWLMGSHTRC